MGYYRNLFLATVAFMSPLEVFLRTFYATLSCFCKRQKRVALVVVKLFLYLDILFNFWMSKG